MKNWDYRKRHDWWVFKLYLYDKEDDTFCCDEEWFEDSRIYETERIKENSKPANILDIITYKIKKWILKD